jgi:ketose-bisphosphate aldolase
MSIVSAKEILLEATEARYAIGAFNVTNIIQMEGVVQAALNKKAPLIIQTSVTPSQFIGPDVIVAVYRTLASSAPIPIALHIDHCTDVAYCKTCVDAGYTNIMIDGSKHDFEGNIRVTREVCDYAHKREHVSVEGELGTVSGVEDQVKVAEDASQLCDPAQAEEFVERSGVDLFAPAIGTAHGVYKTKNPKLDFDRLEKIAKIFNSKKATVPIIIHGGTGLQPDVVKRLVALGGSKFNVSTDLKHALIDATWDYLAKSREDYNPGALDKVTKAATIARVEYWIDLLGSAGKAS